MCKQNTILVFELYIPVDFEIAENVVKTEFRETNSFQVKPQHVTAITKFTISVVF